RSREGILLEAGRRAGRSASRGEPLSRLVLPGSAGLFALRRALNAFTAPLRARAECSLARTSRMVGGGFGTRDLEPVLRRLSRRSRGGRPPCRSAHSPPPGAPLSRPRGLDRNPDSARVQASTGPAQPLDRGSVAGLAGLG